MSVLAWKVLAEFIRHVQASHEGEYGRGYIASWILAKAFDCDINAIDMRINPRNDHERALKELVDLGLIEEMSDLHERFRLVVK